MFRRQAIQISRSPLPCVLSVLTLRASCNFKKFGPADSGYPWSLRGGFDTTADESAPPIIPRNTGWTLNMPIRAPRCYCDGNHESTQLAKRKTLGSHGRCGVYGYFGQFGTQPDCCSRGSKYFGSAGPDQKGSAPSEAMIIAGFGAWAAQNLKYTRGSCGDPFRGLAQKLPYVRYKLFNSNLVPDLA